MLLFVVVVTGSSSMGEIENCQLWRAREVNFPGTVRVNFSILTMRILCLAGQFLPSRAALRRAVNAGRFAVTYPFCLDAFYCLRTRRNGRMEFANCEFANCVPNRDYLRMKHL